jgi:hypothetical protein
VFSELQVSLFVYVMALSRRRSVSLITNEIKVVGNIARSFTAGRFGVPY